MRHGDDGGRLGDAMGMCGGGKREEGNDVCSAGGPERLSDAESSLAVVRGPCTEEVLYEEDKERSEGEVSATLGTGANSMVWEVEEGEARLDEEGGGEPSVEVIGPVDRELRLRAERLGRATSTDGGGE